MYNGFAVSVLQFYLQFYGVTDDLLAAEKRWLAKVFKGPGNWVPGEVVAGLRGQLGALWGAGPAERFQRGQPPPHP